MKTSKLFLAITAIMIAFGCAKIETPNTSTIPRNDKGEYAIVFSNGNPLTKSITNPATTHDYTSFEVYAWQDGTATAWSPYTVSKNGNEWKYDGIGTQELQYFDRNSDKYDFLGVITGGTVAPANGSVGLNVTGVKAFENNDDETTTPDELLWAQAAVEKAAYDSEVALTFKHANAKMYIGFVSDRNDTQILDYTPYTPGTPAKDAWDETVDVTTYQMTVTTIPTQGPAIADINITDEDIAYINGKYTASKGFDNYATQNVITGPLDEDMYGYLKTKYPALATATLNNWASNVTNSNMRLIHIDKTGQYNTYVGVWVNVQNVNWTNGTTTQTVIHHDAVPPTPASGYEGIRVFSVSTDATTGKNIRTPHTTEASAVLGNNTCVLTQTANSGDGANSNITFVKPTGAVAQVADFTTVDENTTVTWSPTVWYALPVANPDNGYVVKFSYTYNGVDYYDARVHIPATDSAFEQGKYYRYVICIGNKSNGSTDPGEAGTDKDEVDTDNLPIRFTVVVSTYINGEFKYYILSE